MPSDQQNDDALDAAVDAAQQGRGLATQAVAEGLPPLSPDYVEQTIGTELDNIVPTRGYEMIPIIALGGSAGSLPAMYEFFRAMPADAGMVFVVVLHLSPEHESSLPQILQRHTAMPVRQAEDGAVVEVNHVYVIPPGKFLASADGHLRLTELGVQRGKRFSVDVFFRTLADTHGPHAAAIVLSGADGDGAIGLKRVKERGGLTVAQDPDEAEHSSMPRSAIDTGMVDWVLRVKDMPPRLLEYMRRDPRPALPPEATPASTREPTTVPGSEHEKPFLEVLAFLRARTGRDFSYYKRATLLRRVSRRMQVNTVETLPDYLAFLRTHPGESGALLQDLLISVTNFFRDPEAFTALELCIPALFRGKGPRDTVRVWCAACATGEEAYSVAMLLAEHARKLEAPPLTQVFATDLDEEAVRKARDGLYPASIATDVSTERLRRFFVKEHGGYRVRRELRETALFAWHDLLKDAPFSRLDLVTCRNLLIYLNREAQRRALDLFHFALIPEGRLFLGTAESVDDASELFVPFDKKHRLYTRQPVARVGLPVPIGVGTILRSLQEQEHAAERPTLPPVEVVVPPPGTALKWRRPEPTGGAASWGELHLRLFEQAGPPSLVIDSHHDIVHLSEAAGRYLQFTAGEPTKNLMRVIHPMLRMELRAVLYRAASSRRPEDAFGLPVDLDGRAASVDLRVSPAPDASPYFLVTFTPHAGATAVPRPARALSEADPITRELERELERLKTHLRDVVEQNEATAEEQKAGNEELQAINEELRSATEELETSREELQSINEELTTVNQELKSKVEELGHTNSDLHNLINATAIATVFLDRDLCITRYTPTATALFNLIPTDLGRPLTDLTHRLDYPELEADAHRVLTDLVTVEREVAQPDENCYLVRLLPYRTTNDHIAGVVLTFVDITEGKRADAALRRSEEQFRRALEDSPVPVIMHAEDGQVLQISRSWTELTGYTHEDIPTFDAWLNRAYGFGADRLREEVRQLFKGETLQLETEVEIITRHGERRLWSFHASAPGTLSDGRRFTVGMALDITERRRAEAALQDSEERMRVVVDSARDFAIFTMDEEGIITRWNSGAETLFGHTAAGIVGRSGTLVCVPEDHGDALREEMAVARRDGRAVNERWHLRRDGSRFWGSGSLVPLRPGTAPGGGGAGFLMILSDRTQAREAEQALESNQQQLRRALEETESARAEAETASQAKDHFLAVLSHELRTPLTPVLMALVTLGRRNDLPPQVRDAHAMIERNVQLEAHFIDDLLDVTRITHGKIEIARQDMDLHEAITRAVEVSAPDFEAKGQQVDVRTDAREHRVNGDFARLQQALWNLLKNASKFTPEGGKISVRSRNEPGRVIIEVKDDGIGLESAAVERIFYPFEQAEPAITREFGGLGLGLAIARATVQAHEGELRADSPGLGRGATFTMSLPLAS